MTPRFIEPDGTEIEPESMRERFFQSASDAGVPIEDAEHFWQAALNGDEDIWDLIEGTCGVSVVASNAGFT